MYSMELVKRIEGAGALPELEPPLTNNNRKKIGHPKKARTKN